jgi:cytochrome c-type biogenesis protein CcmH
MLLWVYVGLMTAAAIAAVLWPLVRRRAAAVSGTDAAVYRDQLQEIDRDLRLGLIPANEAEAARIEVSRRLLAASDNRETAGSVSNPWRRHLIGGFAVLVLTIGAGGLYLRVGAPLMASESAPLPARAEAAATIERLVAQAEDYLTHNPRDARGWEVLGPVYMRIGRYSDSANAWRNSIQLAGENADRLANLGEALTAEANGIVTADAKDAFSRSVALDQTTVTSRFYLALAAEQDGKASESAGMLKQLIADAPANAPWLGDVRTALARVEGKPDGAALKPLAPISTAASDAPKDAAVTGMVERLAERLKQDGSDPDGWVRLVRSYEVLKDDAKKSAAIENARKALASDAEKLARFDNGLKAIEAGGEPPPLPSATAVPPGKDAGQHEAESMTERLAQRLQKSGSDPEGWLMLTRSYATLQQSEKAKAAVQSARAALAGDPDKLEWFNDAVKRFKLE